MKKNILFFIIFLCKIQLIYSQNFFDNYNISQKTKEFYYNTFLKRQLYIGTPIYKFKLDSINNILDSVGYSEYTNNFVNKETDFMKYYNRLLLFNPQNIDSTLKYLEKLSDKSRHFFYFVKKYTETILPYCFDYKKNQIQRDLLIMLNIPDTLKESLLKCNDLELWQKIRLGDTITENKLINKFKESVFSLKNSYDLNKIIELGHTLLASGSLKALKAYIYAFDCNKVIEIEKGKYMTTILSRLISDYNTFFDYYPQYYILSSSYQICHIDDNSIRHKSFFMYDFEKHYVKQIEKFCLDEFGIELNIKIPFFDLHDYFYVEDEDLQKMLEKYK